MSNFDKIRSDLMKIHVKDVEDFDPLEKGIVVENMEELKNSIQRIGLVNPIILLKVRNGKYRVASGARRLIAARSLGYKEIDAYVVEDDSFSLEDAYTLFISENLSHRHINLIELSFIVNNLQNESGLGPSETVEIFFPLMHLEKSLKIHKMLTSLSSLASYLKRYVIVNNIALQISHTLSKLNGQEQDTLKVFLESMNLSSSELKEVLTNLREISVRDDVLIYGIIKRPDFQALLNNERLNKKQKGDLFRKMVKEVRYPEICRMEGKMYDLKRSLSLPKGVRLIPPINYDEGNFTFEIDFSSRDELRERISYLSKMNAKQQFEKMLEAF